MKRKLIHIVISCVALQAAVLLCAVSSLADDVTNLGGDLTTTLPGRAAIQVTAPNVTDSTNIQKQLDGFKPFHKNFTRKEGLGPAMNNRGCGSCHIENGKGPIRIRGESSRLSAVVVKVSLPGLGENGSPTNVPGVGEQLLDSTISGKKSRYRMRLRWTRVRGTYADGTPYTLRKPRLRFRVRGYKRSDIVSSMRMSPLLIGSGLLEAIREADILALADPNDEDGDGISGRPMYVPNLRTGELELGRFGFKASHPTLEQQTAAAAFNDIGITNSLFTGTDEEGATELTDEELDILVVYQALAGVPIARDQTDEDVVAGKDLFELIGCHSCHTMTVQTEHATLSELDGQTIHPFTDMLLHDMGPDLADERAEYSAAGSEWRTTPLWGMGFAKTVSRVKPRFLHDGRARNLEEAILWHGGEAETARERFKALPKAQRDKLIKFLRSL